MKPSPQNALTVGIVFPLVSFIMLMFVAGCTKKDSPVTANSNPTDSTQPFQSPIPKTPGDFPVPADNPQTDAKVDLGRHLFYDKSLSVDNSTSCASCHQLRSGFADIFPASQGFNKQHGTRNAPTLTNIAYSTSFNWDGAFSSLEDQAPCPIYNSEQLGNNFSSNPNDTSAKALVYNSVPGAFDTNFLFKRINSRDTDRNGKSYKDLFLKAWGDTKILMDRVAKSLAAFERTIISSQSDFDKYNNGDPNVFLRNPSAIHGFKLFIDTKGANCISCHSGFNFTDQQFHDNGIGINQAGDIGRSGISKDPKDAGKFKTPSLRNVAQSSPYMHDGRFKTLEQVLANYNKGGIHPTSNTDPKIRPLNLSDQDLADIIEFLKTLTDSDFISDIKGKFSDPW